MNAVELIGLVAAAYLKRSILEDGDSEGTARYMIDCMGPSLTVAVAMAVLNDQELSERVEIKLPASYVGDADLPEHVLTRERTTYFRNAACTKEVLLVASVGDDERLSLNELTPIGSSQLLAYPELWLECVNDQCGLDEEKLRWWCQCLSGLLRVRGYSLNQFAEFILATVYQITGEGEPLLPALGMALPALRAPRDKEHYSSVSKKNGGHLAKWEALHKQVINRRACYMLKQAPNQSLISSDVLRTSFEQVRESIPGECHDVIIAFIAAPSGWNEEAYALCQFDWSAIEPLFSGLKKESFNLGTKTKEFFLDRHPEELNVSECQLLNLLEKRQPRDPDEEILDFFEVRRKFLQEDIALKTRWDKYIFGAPIECTDFLVGLVQCMSVFFDQGVSDSCVFSLSIRSDKRTPHQLRGLNHNAGCYFAMKYRAIQQLLPQSIQWDIGDLFEFDTLQKEWESKKQKINRSRSRGALQIKFFVELQRTESGVPLSAISKQLVWKFDDDAVCGELRGDLTRLLKHPFTQAMASREPISGKGTLQPLDLRNASSLYASYRQDRGSLVPRYDKKNDIELNWKEGLKIARDSGLIAQPDADNLSSAWNEFSEAYVKCLSDVWNQGYSLFLEEQAIFYAKLIDLAMQTAEGDRVRELIVKPLLKIGVASIDGNSAASIVPPWNPFRFLELKHKVEKVCDLVTRLLREGVSVVFSDSRLYFRDLSGSLASSYYPEVSVDWRNGSPELLACTDHYLDYSVHENPIAVNNGMDDTNDNPNAAANLLSDLVRRYLDLYPHERSNLSTVLYNCDSAKLPQTAVSKMADLNVGNEDLRCEVILRHRDSAQLANLYERIVEGGGDSEDAYGGSESSSDFMARLRIGIMADQAPTPPEEEGRPTDIVFLDDVIARHARLEWFALNEVSAPLLSYQPPEISRRKPSAEDDMESVVYLVCPTQPDPLWSYSRAIASFFCASREQTKGKCYVPARALNFGSSDTSQIFDEAHRLGNWVVNFDELLDRRQLRNQGVRVIRFKRFTNGGKNVLVSSKAPLGLLRTMVQRRIESLQTNLQVDDIVSTASKMIDCANGVSGDLALRAAKRGRSASELVGVVLSQYLVENELGTESLYGWFFLDDYAEWLGQKEGRIADLIALQLSRVNGRFQLGIIITEAKYIDHASLASKRKESQQQLRETVDRIREALLFEPARYDRNLWITRLGNLIADGIHIPKSATVPVASWIEALHRQECDINVRGYSHVFISAPSDCPDCSERVAVPKLSDCYQEVFSRRDTARLVETFWHGMDPAELRNRIGEGLVLPVRSFRTIKPPEPEPVNQRSDKNTNNRSDVESHPNGGTSDEVESPPLNGDSTSKHGGESDDNNKLSVKIGLDQLLSTVKPNVDDSEDSLWLDKTAVQMKTALHQYGLKAKLSEKKLTPNCALLKYQGSDNMTVTLVEKHRGELLTTYGLDLISIRPEPGNVCISIPRPKRQVLKLHALLKEWNICEARNSAEVIIGINEDNNEAVTLSPKRNAPHTLVAGATGSGKSVLLQNIILSVAFANDPSDAKLLLIDPKRVSFNRFSKLPHLERPIVKEQSAAAEALEMLVCEMTRRYKLFEEHGVEDVYELRSMGQGADCPLLWVIHDEFALWMVDDEYSAIVDSVVKKLAVAARAAGIFLVFAAQRPDNQVFSMQLRANLGNRLVLRVDAPGTSDIALGEKNLGAERLLGNGHMIARMEGLAQRLYLQVPFASGEEAKELANVISARHT